MVKIIFGDLRIQSISQSSGVFSGENETAGWKHFSKTNEGFGKVAGNDNMLESNYHLVLDNDLFEFVQKKDG
ncbi:hypothetical protein [Paenibacillus hamazuiensis]|uniref:hypothetical protein n=1 Tax=Paenibacillus hamazuiensis TaxID=2936508 RepID=UPI00200D41E8|nr:hypothetical protein [Paenibacillus hamazuiensis]